MKKKYFMSLALLSMVLFPLVSCNQSNETKITILSEFDFLNVEKLVEEEFDDIDFAFEKSFYPSEQTRRLRKNHGPSLVVTNGYDGEFYNKYLMDISSSYSSTLYDDSIMKQLASEGRTYCLPFPGKYLGYIYNATLFEENEIETPTTNKEFTDAISKLRTLNLGTGVDDSSLALVYNYSSNIGKYYLSLAIPDFFGTMDGSQWLTGFRKKTSLMKDNLDYVYEDIVDPLITKEFVDVDVLSRKRNSIEYTTRMIEGSLVATFGDSGILNEINATKTEACKYEYKMLPLLSDEGNHPWTVTFPSNYIGINKAKNKKEQELCVKILELISSKAGQEALMKDVKGGFSYLKEDVDTNSSTPSGLEGCVDKGYIYYPKLTGRITDYLGEVIVDTIVNSTDINDSLAKVDDYNINGSEEVDSNFHVVGLIDEDMILENYNVRKGETTLGNLVADSVKYAANADIAVINGGGVRASLYEGEIFESDLKVLCPFANLIVVVNMSGKTMYEMIENGLSNVNDPLPSGRFLQCSGIKYTFSSGNAVGSRLSSITLSDGTPIDKSKTYKVAINNYMAGSSGYDLNNGDGYSMLNIYDEKTIKGQVELVSETKKTYFDALYSYFNEYFNYSPKLENRITDLSKGTAV